MKVSSRNNIQARNVYFLAIKNAKRAHWNQFLEKEDSKSIFKALSYTRNKRIEKLPPIEGKELFQDKCNAFRNTLFPQPPIAPKPIWDNYNASEGWKWLVLDTSELASACLVKIKGKTLGPDLIT